MPSLDPKVNPHASEIVARQLGGNLAHVIKNYPGLFEALRAGNCVGKYPLAVALGTISVENPTFDIIKERGSVKYLTDNYDVKGLKPERAKRYGNTSPGDGPKYCGRGLIQLTWKSNYEKYGKIIGVDLVNHPDRALEPDIAFKLFVAYFKDHGVDVWAQRYGDNKVPASKEIALQKCRKLVNGGLNHYDRFKKNVEAFVRIQGEP